MHCWQGAWQWPTNHTATPLPRMPAWLLLGQTGTRTSRYTHTHSQRTQGTHRVLHATTHPLFLAVCRHRLGVHTVQHRQTAGAPHCQAPPPPQLRTASPGVPGEMGDDSLFKVVSVIALSNLINFQLSVLVTQKRGRGGFIINCEPNHWMALLWLFTSKASIATVHTSNIKQPRIIIHISGRHT